MAKKESKGQGVKLAIRQAGEGGITKQELNNITKSTGQSADTVIRRLDAVNQSLKSNDRARIGLNSGAANMLINQNTKNPVSPFSQGKGYGTGQIGETLQSMMGSPGYTAPRNPQSGGPYGGSRSATPAQMMIGGTQIRGGGRVAVKGFGKQYTYTGGNSGPYDGMEIKPFDPNGPGPLAPKTNTDPTQQDPVTADPVASTSDPGSGMLTGGGAAFSGAAGLRRKKSYLRSLGIRGMGQLGRSQINNMYKQTVNLNR